MKRYRESIVTSEKVINYEVFINEFTRVAFPEVR